MDRFLEIAPGSHFPDFVTATLDELADQGVMAAPVALGWQGQPKGVFLTLQVAELAAPAIARVQKRPLSSVHLLTEGAGAQQMGAGIDTPVFEELARLGVMASPAPVRWSDGTGALVSVALFAEIYRDIDAGQTELVAGKRLGLTDSDQFAETQVAALYADLGISPDGDHRADANGAQ